jgi:NAD(P)-dependent dehydrogenase (short-subunit alcohol dehydrogenase family)
VKIIKTTAVVTGAVSGLGAASGADLAAKGARVVSLDLSVDGVPAPLPDTDSPEDLGSNISLESMQTIHKGSGPQAGDLAGDDGLHDL